MAKKVVVRKSLPRRRSVTRLRLTKKVLEKAIQPVKPIVSRGKKIAITILILFILGALGYNFKHLFVVALVNQTPIARFTFDRQLEKQIGKDFLENEISRQLILQEAAKQKIEVQTSEIDTKVTEIEKQIEDRGAKLEDLLAAQGQTRDSLRDQLRVQLIIEKILAKDISVTEEEIKTYYDQNKASFAEDQTLDQVKTSVAQQLFQQKLSEKISPWLADLRAKAQIRYFLTF
ncbi:MAG: SurA N-terminal domain-containing protein [Candidatus Shapirobacteria bacterium]